MKTHLLNPNEHFGWLIAALLAMAATARSAETASLKDAYKDDFKVGAAINRTIAMNAVARGQTSKEPGTGR